MRKAQRTILAGVFLLLCGGPILAQTTYTWTGAATSAWNNNANWTPATGFPLAADNAIITGVGNSPVLDANRTVTNLTVTSGALNLAGFNLTATGTGNYSGGSLSTGGLVLNASANVVTFSGTVFNSQVSGSGADIRLSGSTFNQPVNLVMTGAASSTSQGGNTFNAPVQLAINNTGNLVLTNTNNDAFNGDLQLSSTGAGTIRFGSSVGVATLAAGRTISAGAGGFSIGTLNLGGFVQLGTTAQTLTLTGTAVLNMNPGTVFNADLNVTAPRLYLNGGTYQGNTRFTMTGALNAGGAGGCVFNGILDLTVTGAGELYLHGTNNDLFNNNVRVNSVGGAGIRFGIIGSGTGTLASGRTITVGAAGFNNGYLYLGNFIQLGSTAQTITTTGTSLLYMYPGSIFNADLDVTAPRIYLDGGTFQGNTRFTMNSGANADGSGGCVFNGPLELTTTGAGTMFLHSVNNDLFNNNVRLNSTGGGGIRFGNGPGTGTLATGRTMAVGAAGFTSGNLILGNFTQLGSTPQSLLLTGTSTLYFYAGTTFNANLTTSSPRLYLNGATFNGASSFTKTGAGTDACVGGNLFNGITEFISTGSSELWLHVTTNDAFNNDVRVSSIGGAGIGFGSGVSTGIGTLATGRTISVGAAGFNAGILTLNNFRQIGPTAQAMTLTGAGILKFSPGTIFDGAITTTSPGLVLSGGTFNGAASFTKTGTTNDAGVGGNIYNGQTDLVVTGTGELRLYQTLPDVFNHNLRVASVNGGGIRLGSVGNVGTGALAAGRTITVGPSGFNAGVLYITNFTQLGGTSQSIAMTGTSELYFTTGTTFNANLTTSSPRLFLNGATFQGVSSFTKSGAVNDPGVGGNTFNGTLDLISTGSGELWLHVTSNDAFNNNVRVTSISGAGIGFGSGSSTGIGTLAAGRTILVGAGGFNAGNLTFNNFRQIGPTAQALTLTGTGSLKFSPGTIFDGDITTTSPGLLLSGGTFNGVASFTKNGTTTDTGVGGNVYNATTDLIVTGTGELRLYQTLPDAFNQNLRVTCVNGGGIRLGLVGSAGTGTLAAGRTITVGPSGFNAGVLYLTNFTQQGGTSQSITMSGTSQLYFTTGTTFNAPIAAASPRLFLNGATFQNTAQFTKSGANTDQSTGGNTFNGITDLIVTGTGLLDVDNTGSDAFNADLRVSSTTTGGVRFGQSGGNASLAAGRSISVGALGFASGTLSFRNFTQFGALPNSLLCTGTSSLQFQTGSTFNAVLITTSGALLLNGSTFQGNSRFTKTGATTENSNGGNTFNGLTELIVLGNGLMNLENTTNDAFNGDLQVVCTGTGGIAFGVGTGTATLANGRTMLVGSTGFASGTLNLRNFVQLGGTAQNILLTGTALLQIRTGTIFNGPLTTVSPGLLLDGGTFNSTVDMTKSGTANNSSVGGNTFNGNARLVGAGTGSFLLNNVSSDVFNGTAQLVRTGAGAMHVAYTLNATFNSDISLVGSTGGVIFGQNNGSVYIAGAGDRQLNGVVAFPPYIRNLYMNTSSGGRLLMNVTTDVWNRLGFDNGVIVTSAATSSSNGILRLANGILFPTPASATSYVDGFVRKIGNTAFSFPTGNNGVFAPVSISAPSTATDHFTARYVKASPWPLYNETLRDVSIDHISNCEYWIVDRTNGASNVFVTLGWDTPRSCGVDFPAQLIVARWNGALWKDHGNGAWTGISTIGTVTTAAAATAFGPFTLASGTGWNPLPIELVAFDAQPKGEVVDCSWSTASESNNDRFEVERSADAHSFSLIGTLDGTGNSRSLLHYGHTDTRPLSGTSYYRLRQVDFDGTATYSSVVAVDRKPEAMVDHLKIFPNPVVDLASIDVADLDGKVLIRVLDMAGRTVHESAVAAGSTVALVSVGELIAGVYTVYVRDERGEERSGRLIKE